MKNKGQHARVIDFFCGAGGFSEGFRQEGFDIIMGVDNWKPAILTHNLNHGLNDTVKDILLLEDIEEIEKLPDSEIIVGSPPCVSFSHSNKGGNADKSLGIRLIEAYLRIVAVKKHKKDSVLEAWLMENVPNSRYYVKDKYTFVDLGLKDWAHKNDINPRNIALKVKSKGEVLIASDYGACQARKRYVCGEITKTGKFPFPQAIKTDISLKRILSTLPAPLDFNSKTVIDPNYPSIEIDNDKLTDHYYDTGVYEIEWRKAESHKINHPYMGKMSIPENLNKPSRTIMATRSASTREAILYKSELKRKGDGEYRLPTIREASSIMGFPITYVFSGNEANKWRQIGNAVCPQLARALAESIKSTCNLQTTGKIKFELPTNINEFNYLDNHKPKLFNNPPKRNPDALFRAHPIKSGNMTVALTNKHPKTGEKIWAVFAFVGTGKDYHHVKIRGEHVTDCENILNQYYPAFVNEIKLNSEIVKQSETELYKLNGSHYYQKDGHANHPLSMINIIKDLIHSIIGRGEDRVIDSGNFTLSEIKETIPMSQVMSIYALGLIIR